MNTSISLPDELVGMIEERVASGRYSSSSAVVREALRLLQVNDAETAQARAQLRQAWVDGVDSDDAGLLDFADLKAEARRRQAAYAKD